MFFWQDKLEKKPKWNFFRQMKPFNTNNNFYKDLKLINQLLSLSFTIFQWLSLSFLKFKDWKINKMKFWTKIKIKEL